MIYLVFFGGWQTQEPTRDPAFATHLNSVYNHSIPTLTVNELKEALKAGAIILDTRETNEFDVSHIRYSRHVGYIWFDMRSIYDIPKTDTVVVYCAVGNRSERIAEKLKKAGYQNVFSLFGGLYEWVNRRNPVYNKENIQTTEIHVYDKSWIKWLDSGSPVY